MNFRIATTRDSLRSSYWFVPCMMVAGASLLSFATIALDSSLPTRPREAVWVFAGDAEGARTLLTMLAASMLTVFCVVLSIVIVALTLASSQFGPRMIRTFLSDAVDQIAFGTFISTFVYCVLVARTVSNHPGAEFVPHVSVSVAFLLSLISLGVLIYFVNHLSVSLQASYIIAAIGADLNRTVERELPERVDCGKATPTSPCPEQFASAVVSVTGDRDGYIQAIDYGQLLRLAQHKDLVLRVHVCVGDFLARGDEIASVSPTKSNDRNIASAINAALVVGADRTREQDVEFPINQLVQLAVRALSPAINDPITAIIAIERLRAGLCLIAERGSRSPLLSDDAGRQRVLAKRYAADHHVEAAFDLIRQYGRQNLEVTLSLLESIEQVSRRTVESTIHDALRNQAVMIGNGARESLPEPADRERVAERLKTVLAVLQ